MNFLKFINTNYFISKLVFLYFSGSLALFMYTKALFRYFIDINIFNLPFSILVGLIGDPLWFVISFASIGILFGLLGFQTFKKEEYFMYYNLGISKVRLLLSTVVFNTLISLLFFLLYITFR